MNLTSLLQWLVSLVKPSVTKAVAKLEAAIQDLEQAEIVHRAEAEAHALKIAAIRELHDIEQAAANRAARVRERLSDLLS